MAHGGRRLRTSVLLTSSSTSLTTSWNKKVRRTMDRTCLRKVESCWNAPWYRSPNKLNWWWCRCFRSCIWLNIYNVPLHQCVFGTFWSRIPYFYTPNTLRFVKKRNRLHCCLGDLLNKLENYKIYLITSINSTACRVWWEIQITISLYLQRCYFFDPVIK